MSPDHWTYFEISEENYEIVIRNGIESKLEKGMTIEFLSAPEDFGNGYIRPIVALTIDGVVLLEQEIGIENYRKTIWIDFRPFIHIFGRNAYEFMVQKYE